MRKSLVQTSLVDALADFFVRKKVVFMFLDFKLTVTLENFGPKHFKLFAVLRDEKNVGATVLSARLAKILNLSTTTLARFLCKAREHVAKSGEIRQKTTNR